MKVLNILVGIGGLVEAAEPQRPEMTKVDYQKVYIENPIDVMPTSREGGWTANKNLVEKNKRWLAQKDESKDIVKKMINIKNTVPMTPHGVFRFVDGSDYCWIFYPYDSEEDEEGPIMQFAEHLADYFYERCGVATIDLAYPSNRFMFGYMIDDTPMLFVKKPGAGVSMLNGHFEQGSFTLQDWNEWGFRVTTDKLEDDFDGEMAKILERVYEPQSVFQKTNSVYMEWYGRGNEELYKEKSGANQVMVDYIQKNAKETDEESGEEKQMKMTKPEAFKWFETKTEFILAELQSSGYRIEPQALPSLSPLFKKFRDEL